METALLSPSTLVSVVIALSFAAGLNVYATVFSLGLMARLHWITLPDGLGALGGLGVIIASGILFTGEFFADKIPGFDVIWNVAHTLVRIPVAALMAYAVSTHLSPEMHVLVTCVGAAVAAVAHGSKTAARVAVTPSPEPISNIALSSGEDGVVVGLTWLALHHPGVAVGSVAALTVVGAGVVWMSWRLVAAGFRKVFAVRRASAISA